MGRIKFNPSTNPYTEQLTKLMGQLFIEDWKKKQQQKIMQANLEKLQGMGLFGNMGQVGQGEDVNFSEFGKRPSPQGYISGLNMSTGMPNVKFSSPNEISQQEFQQDVGRYKRAEGAEKTEFMPTPRYMQARGTMESLN